MTPEHRHNEMNTHTRALKYTFTKNGNINSSFPFVLLFPRGLFTSTFVFLNLRVTAISAKRFELCPRPRFPRPHQRQRRQQQSAWFEVMTSFDHAEGLPELLAMRNHAPRIHLHNGTPFFYFIWFAFGRSMPKHQMVARTRQYRSPNGPWNDSIKSLRLLFNDRLHPPRHYCFCCFSENTFRISLNSIGQIAKVPDRKSVV